MNEEIISGIREQLSIEVPAAINAEELKILIAGHINYLINHDFNRLINILYRIDVNELKLRILLKEHHEDAGILIANMILERQMEKIKSRNENRRSGDDLEEKW